MRTLELNETEMVAGGILPAALVPLIKAAAPIVASIATGVVGVMSAKYAASVISDAIDKAADACNQGADVTVKSPAVDMSCSGKKDSGSAPKKSAQQLGQSSGMLKIMFPEYLDGR